MSESRDPADRVSADEARRLRDAAIERTVAGGPVGYVQRMRAAHAATLTPGGDLGVCACGTVGCNAPIWLAHIDNLIQAYRNKVEDLAAETRRSSDLAATVERLEADNARLVAFRDAWEAKIRWGAHALQHPCCCSLDPGHGTCRIGLPLYTDYMRLSNQANGLLGDEARAVAALSGEGER